MVGILSGSPLLEELSLEFCNGLRKPKSSCQSIEELNLDECDRLKKHDLARSDIKHLTIVASGYNVQGLVCPNVKILNIAWHIECAR